MPQVRLWSLAAVLLGLAASRAPANQSAGSYFNQPPPGSSPSVPASGGSGAGGSAAEGSTGNSGTGGYGAAGGGGGQAQGEAMSPETAESVGGRWGGRRPFLSERPPEQPSFPTEPEAAKPAPSEPMSLADARLNFRAVVSNFIGNNSPNGYWPVSDPKTKKTLRLAVKSIDEASVKAADQPSLYVGSAWMSSGARSRPVPVEFTVDLSGVDWKVVKYEINPGR